MKNYVAIIISFWLMQLNGALAPAQTSQPVTVAEKSSYQATSRYADVMDFCEKLAKQSPLVRWHDMGKSSEGRRLPLLIVADPPVDSPEDAAKSGKLVVLAIGNIHAGEVDGKEALLMLARDLVLAPSGPAPSPRPLPQGEFQSGRQRKNRQGASHHAGGSGGRRRHPLQRPGFGSQPRFRQA